MNSISFYLLMGLQFWMGGPSTVPHVESSPGSAYIVEIPDGQFERIREALSDNPYVLDRIHPTSNLYRLELPGTKSAVLLEQLRNADLLTRWQHDRNVHPRNIPNDPLFPEQWDMMRIGMEEAWDRVTGGVTVNGDTIVVAILDTGFDTDHEDLISNLWHNQGEIPGDFIDNDQNGYIDDFLGLNTQTGDDQHEEDVHGTAVAGIIGAEGGNGKGVAGVNWHVKLMLISGIRKESDIIEGYMYIKALRDRYNASGGSEGALVVATNLSVGIDNALPADHMLWCDQYESLGNSGILGVCATTNTNSDVDMFGDMPTTCASDFMVAVTNTGMNDEKLMFAGYGKIHVDLGAPGTPTMTTAAAGGYDEFIGTSAATPHVAGAIALLYAVACNDIIALTTTEPDAVARQMKNLVLDFTDPIAGLQALTVSGGRLNVLNAVAAADALCGNTGGDLEIIDISPNPARSIAVIAYRIPSISTHEVLIFDSIGRLVLHEQPNVSAPGIQIFTLTRGHLAAGVYHFTLRQGKTQVTKSFVVI